MDQFVTNYTIIKVVSVHIIHFYCIYPWSTLLDSYNRINAALQFTWKLGYEKNICIQTKNAGIDHDIVYLFWIESMCF